MSTSFFRKRKKTLVVAIAVLAGVALVGSTLIGAGAGILGALGGGGKYQAELEALEAKVEESPGDVVNWLNLGTMKLEVGLSYMEQGEEESARQYFKESRESFESALEVDDENVRALINKAFASLYLNDMQRAGEDMEKAYEIDPKNPEVLHSYGMYYLQAGQVEEGIEKLEEILQLEELTEAEKAEYEEMIQEYKGVFEQLEKQMKEMDELEEEK